MKHFLDLKFEHHKHFFVKKGGKLPSVSGMIPKVKPYRPTVEELHDNGKFFPPNFLHQSWLDYLYWDVKLES